MIEPGERPDAGAVARLHFEHIDQGFLRSLGVDFLTVLYEYISEHELLFVAREQGEVKGFISASTGTSSMMKRFVIKKFLRVMPTLAKLLFSPNLIPKVLETLFSPGKTEASVSSLGRVPELLSIVIAPEFRGSPISQELLAALEATLRASGHTQYKVVAGASLAAANAYYRKHGFVLAGTVTIHQGETSNVYLKTLS
jgi:ribosomal protein S18 acetylase RimI-like enzyme